MSTRAGISRDGDGDATTRHGTRPAPGARTRTVAAAVLGFAWVCSVGAGWWWFEARLVRPFDDGAVRFEAGALGDPLLALAAGAGADPRRSGRPVLVYLHDARCPCTRRAATHVRSIAQRYGAAGVQVVSVAAPGTRPVRVALGRSPALGAGPTLDGLPAAPAAAVLDAAGGLAYLGPLSAGPGCSSANGLVELVLDALLAGRSVAAPDALGAGCLCPWPAPQGVSAGAIDISTQVLRRRRST